MNLGNLFETSFGDFFVKHHFEPIPGAYFDDPRGHSETFANADFRVMLSAEPSVSGGIIAWAQLCPASGPDNLGWLNADRVLSHLAGRIHSELDFASTATEMTDKYEALKTFFREDDGYSDRWHLLQAFGNPKWVFVAPRWRNRSLLPDQRSE